MLAELHIRPKMAPSWQVQAGLLPRSPPAIIPSIIEEKDMLLRLVKRAAITAMPTQPTINWTNAIDEDAVKIGEGFWPEKHVYLIEAVSDIIPSERDVIVRPYFEAILEEGLDSRHRLERAWPSRRTFEAFLAWFEVAIHLMVLDLRGSIRFFSRLNF